MKPRIGTISFQPIDCLSIVFYSFLLIIAFVFWPQLARPGFLLFRVSAFLLALILLCRVCTLLNERKENPEHPLGPPPGHARCWHALHDIYPVLLMVNAYDSLGELVPQITKEGFDKTFEAVDTWIIGQRLEPLLDRAVIPWLSDLLQIGYCTYFFWLFCLLILFYRRRDDNHLAYDDFIFHMLVGFYLCFLGYIVFPTMGPRKLIADTPVTSGIWSTLNNLEKNKFDAFPSGHAAEMLLMTFLAHRHARKLLALVVVSTVLVITATVYCRYHYIADVLAGAVVMLGVVAGAPRLRRLLSRESIAEASGQVDSEKAGSSARPVEQAGD